MKEAHNFLLIFDPRPGPAKFDPFNRCICWTPLICPADVMDILNCAVNQFALSMLLYDWNLLISGYGLELSESCRQLSVFVLTSAAPSAISSMRDCTISKLISRVKSMNWLMGYG